MTEPMIPRERSDYSAIVDRPVLQLPGGARIVIWTPFRIKFLEAIYDYVNQFEGVVHWNGEQILDWYSAETAGKPAAKP